MKKNIRLARQQLDARLWNFRPLLDIPIPSKGWIRAVRDALGMSGRQLGDRLGVTRQREEEMERHEVAGAATLKTMRRIAESLDCVFVYGLVPRTSLEQMVQDRARQVAEKRLARASQTMRLEDQELSKEENERILAGMVEELVDTLPSTFWNES